MIISDSNEIEEATCSICMENYLGENQKQIFPLMSCEHVFHKSCLAGYFSAQVSESKFPLCCPELNCKKQCFENDIKQILDKKMHKLYLERSLSMALDQQGNIQYCLTPNCSYAMILETGVRSFDCPVCKKKYCINCKEDTFHQGLTCEEYKKQKIAKINNKMSKKQKRV